MESCFNLSKDEDTEGFDLEGGKIWIYPTNMPLRDYQFNIIQRALLKNTLVCLPTGLGKTFIAAVVMYNFFRWYPNGKIIFMAPTKPLVNQQIDACYNIVAIPKSATAELTGSTIQTSRDDIWNTKRVFFITPQVLQNDLERISKLGNQIKCLVFDEAHKARGNQAYCEIMRQLYPVNKYFRVLALSATPGNTVADVVNVCQSLLISHLEIRTEDSLDVRPYVFKRTISTVVVPFDNKLKQTHDDYIKILDRYVRVLINHKVVQGNCSMLTKGRLFYVMKEFEEKHKHIRSGSYNEIMKNLNICIILYHAFEVLTKHGLRGFLTFFQEHADKPLLRHNNDIIEIMEDITQYLGPIPVVDMLPDGSVPEIPETTKFGHPKYYKLAEIILSHFQSCGEGSKVIVFCEFRESVMEAYTILLKNKGIIKPRIFLGQGVMTQKQQILIIESFKKGLCNTLISTSIGEEGLDIGEIDLVICFDISNKSSIRMIQRMGRTGRKREGKVIMLVTEGKEQQLLRDCLAQKDCIANTIAKSKELANMLYKENPRMVPKNISPTCNKMFITVSKPKEKLKNKDLLSMFNNMGHSNVIDAKEEIENFTDRIPGCNMELENITKKVGNINYSKHLSKQRVLHSINGCVSSSEDTKLLVSLLQISDSKRYNIPLTQCITTSSSTSENFKQSDIRSMFKKQSSFQSSQNHMEPEPTQPKENNKLQQLNAEIKDVLRGAASNDHCEFCDNLFRCDSYSFKASSFKIDNWVPPDISTLDYLTEENLNVFSKNDTFIQEFDEFDDILANFDETELSIIEQKSNLSSDGKDILKNQENDLEIQFAENKSNVKLDKSVKLEEKSLILGNSSKCFDLDAEINALEHLYDSKTVAVSVIESPTEKTAFNFEMPKNAQNILKNHTGLCTQEEFAQAQITQTADIFRIPKHLQYDDHKLKNTLSFFKLNSLEDLFVTAIELDSSYDSDATIICSPNEYLNKDYSKFVETREIIALGSPIIAPPEKHTNIEKSHVISSSYSNVSIKQTVTMNKKEIQTNVERSPIISSNNGSDFCKPITLNNFESPIISSSERRLKVKKGQKRLFSEVSPIKNVPNKVSKTLDDTDIFDDDFLNFAMNKPVDIQKKNETRGHSPDIFGSYSSGSKTSANLDDFFIDNISTSPKNTSPDKGTKMEASTSRDTLGGYKKSNQQGILEKLLTNKSKCLPVKETFNSLEIDDICDDSILNFFTCNTMDKINKSKINVNKNQQKDACNVIGNIRNKGLFKEDTLLRKKDSYMENSEIEQQKNVTNRKECLTEKITINDICDTSILDIFSNVDLDTKSRETRDCPVNKTNIKSNPSLIASQKENQYLLGNISQSKTSASAKSSLLKNIGDDLHRSDDDFEEPFAKLKTTQSPEHSKIYKTPNKTKPTERINEKLKHRKNSLNVSPKLNNSDSEFEHSPVLSSCKGREIMSQKKTFNENAKADLAPESEDDIFLLSPIYIPPTDNFKINNKTSKLEEFFTISSDEFDDSPLKPKKPILTNTNKRKLSEKRKHNRKSNSNSSDDFEESLIKVNTLKNKKHSKKKRSDVNPFLVLEAQLSSDVEVSEDEEGGSSQDMLESSFVNDETHDFANTTNMRIHYRQSVRSPVNSGKFKIPQLPKTIDRDIYSQAIDESEENSYENDSFCVDTTIDLTQHLSELEIAEMILKERRRNKKKGADKVKPKSKRRRIIIVSDDSD